MTRFTVVVWRAAWVYPLGDCSAVVWLGKRGLPTGVNGSGGGGVTIVGVTRAGGNVL